MHSERKNHIIPLSFEKYNKGIETFFINSDPEYKYTSSTLVRKLLELNLSIDKYVHNAKYLNELSFIYKIDH